MATAEQSILDEISSNVSKMTDEQLAQAAAEIVARNQRARDRVTPETKEKMKLREKQRRLTGKEILRLAKEKGLLAQAQANVAAQQAQDAETAGQ